MDGEAYFKSLFLSTPLLSQTNVERRKMYYSEFRALNAKFAGAKDKVLFDSWYIKGGS